MTSATENDLVSKMKDTVSEASSKITSLLNVDSPPLIKNSHTNSLFPKTETSITSSPKRTNSLLADSCTKDGRHESSPRELHQTNRQTSHIPDKTVENVTLDNVTREASPIDVSMDTETEKEDVTATLALLNSMASELDQVLDVEGAL